jgi:hypothetical protein
LFKKELGMATAAVVVAGLIVGVARPGRAQSTRAGVEKLPPILYLWVHVIKDALAMRGDSFFELYIKDAGLPGPDPEDKSDRPALRFFTAHIISMTPPTWPKEIVVGIEKPDVADAKLEFDMPLPGRMDAGEEIQFWGVATDWSHDPKKVIVTFEIVDPKTDLKGWTDGTPTK